MENINHENEKLKAELKIFKIKALKEKLNINLPNHAGGILVGDVDGNLEDEIDYQLEVLKNSFKENGATDFIVADTNKEAQELWYARRNASPSITIYGNKKLNEDKIIQIAKNILVLTESIKLIK